MMPGYWIWIALQMLADILVAGNVVLAKHMLEKLADRKLFILSVALANVPLSLVSLLAIYNLFVMPDVPGRLNTAWTAGELVMIGTAAGIVYIWSGEFY